jgi:hypothetical protein
MPSNRDDQKDRDERFGKTAPQVRIATLPSAKNQPPNGIHAFAIGESIPDFPVIRVERSRQFAQTRPIS